MPSMHCSASEGYWELAVMVIQYCRVLVLYTFV